MSADLVTLNTTVIKHGATKSKIYFQNGKYFQVLSAWG